MKCPSCENILSDLRDICPQCTTDLRTFKKAIGKPIRNPSLGYEELLAKEMNRPLLPSSSPTGKARSFLGSLFQRKPRLDQNDIAPPKETEPLIAARSIAGSFHTKEGQKAEVSFTWGSPESEEGSQPTEKKAVAPPPLIDAPAPVIELKHVIEEDDVGNDPVEIAFDESELVVPTVPNTAQIHTPTSQNENIDISEPGDAGKTMVDSPPPTLTSPRTNSSPPSTGIKASSAELSELFDAARSEIGDPDSLSVSVEQIQKLDAGRTREKIELFFALAQEAIDNPEFERTLAKKIAEAESRHVSSDELLAELVVTEKAVSTPLLSLKKRGEHSDAVRSETPDNTAEWVRPPPRPAAGGVRFFGAAVDLLVLILLSSGLSAMLFGDLPEGVSSPGAPEMIPLYATSIMCFVVALSLYQLLSIFLFGTTAGSVATGSRVANNDGSAIPFRKLLVRSLSVPLSIVLGGGLPALFGWRALHDVISRSMVIESSDLVS